MKSKLIKRAVCAALIGLMLGGSGVIGANAAELDAEPAAASEGSAKQTVSDLPSSYSSYDLGYVTYVKQQQYNTCWAHASMGTLESFLLRNGIAADSMSVNHLNMWASERSNGKGWQRSIFNDAYPSTALGYMTSWQGGVFCNDLENDTLSSEIKGDRVATDMARYGITAVKYLHKGEFEEIKTAIMENGGVFTSYSNATNCWSADKCSYFMPEEYSGGGAGHSIEVIGWDDNYSRENFVTPYGELPKNNGAWLIKNSWGMSYNKLGGLFWMSYEDAYLFSNKYNPSYILCGFETIDSSKKLIQNEIYGATYEFGYINKNKLTYVNRLPFDSNFNAIDKVVFETKAKGASYTIDFVPDGTDHKPDANTESWTRLYSGTVDYEGYICADIEDFVYPEAGGSIAVTIDNSANGAKSTLGVGEWLTTNGEFVFLNESKPGDSFIYQNGIMQDLLDWYLENENDAKGGTFVIKAVTTQFYPVTLLGDANMDGRVNIQDVTEIQRHVAEISKLTGSALKNADYNQDGSVTIDDATAIQRFLAEFEA